MSTEAQCALAFVVTYAAMYRFYDWLYRRIRAKARREHGLLP